MSEWAVPGYTELKPLGEGGFGTVVLARHDATGTPVAIKYLRSALLDDPEFAEAFRAEAVTLASLDDSHVVRLYEYVESPAGAAIVMELVDGVTLRDMLKRLGRTAPEAALVILYGSLLGLAAAHARGVVHRDYKPANVLINAYGASKLTDFGIAARTGTQTIPAGTLAYAPPEQFSGARATPASDVYAATATFYECLTGRPPFGGETAETLIRQHRFEPVPMDQVPGPLQQLVASGMAKDPRSRPADAAALARGLRGVAAGAYGTDWENRGRSHLAEAALLLAALWPSAGVPGLQGSATERVHLSRGTTARHAQDSPATRHRLHLWHVRHEEHLAHLRFLRRLRTATAVVAAVAVVAAAATVVATRHSGNSSGPAGSPGRPAVSVYPVALETIPLTVSSQEPTVDGLVYVTYNAGSASVAQLTGHVDNPAGGEVVRLYAQQFPFTSAPVPAGSVTLSQSVSQSGGQAQYSFQVAPVLATRYQIRVFRSATAPAAMAESAITTVYSVASLSRTGNARCTGSPVCQLNVTYTVHQPPSTLRTEMAKQWYVYVGINQATAADPSPGPPRYLELYTSGVIGAARLVAANTYTRTVSFSYNVGNGRWYLQWEFCFRDTEAQDGTGLPGTHGCGSPRIVTNAAYVG